MKPDTVGPAVKGVELKFTPERELLIRSPGLFKEYYKNPQATARSEGRARAGSTPATPATSTPTGT